MSSAFENEIRLKGLKEKEDWLKRNKFNEEGYTFIATGDTYSIREQLKKDGFKFDTILLWHNDHIPEGYEDNIISFHYSELLEFNLWGVVSFYLDTRDKIRKLTQPEIELPPSEYFMEDSFTNLPVTLISQRLFDGQFGLTHIFTFKNDANNYFVWFTTTNPAIKEGDVILLTGRVKKREEYRGMKNTVVTRCKVKLA